MLLWKKLKCLSGSTRTIKEETSNQRLILERDLHLRFDKKIRFYPSFGFNSNITRDPLGYSKGIESMLKDRSLLKSPNYLSMKSLCLKLSTSIFAIVVIPQFIS